MIDNCLSKGTPDVLLLSETWLTPFLPKLQIPGYETYQRNRLEKKGGGVAILLSSKLRYTPLNVKFESNVFESIFVNVLLRNEENVTLGSIYRPPNTNPTKFNEEYLVVKTL